MWGYALMFVATVVEGPIVMTFGGFLVRLGYFGFLPLYLTLMAGDLVADVLWYAVGYHWGNTFVRRWGKFFSITQASVLKVQELFHKHHNTILLTSKITMGFGFALVTLIVAGMSKVPFKKYLAVNAIGQFIWTGILMYVGYAFGDLYVRVNEGLHRIVVIAFFTIVLFLLYGLTHYIRTKKNRAL